MQLEKLLQTVADIHSIIESRGLNNCSNNDPNKEQVWLHKKKQVQFTEELGRNRLQKEQLERQVKEHANESERLAKNYQTLYTDYNTLKLEKNTSSTRNHTSVAPSN